MDISKVISANLTAWMESTPALDTFKKLATKSGAGFGTVQRAKNGDGNITVEKLSMIAAAFGRAPSDLLVPPCQDAVPAQDREANDRSDAPVDSRSDPDEMLTMGQHAVEAAQSLAQEAAHIASIWLALPADQRDAVRVELEARSTESAASSMPPVTRAKPTGTHGALDGLRQTSGRMLPVPDSTKRGKKESRPREGPAGE
jgi:transcriptional regulator with XRE-family HTH domain